MRTMVVHAPGMLTTVQDLGREGFGPLGVSASGAADSIALRVGNRLVGNPEDAAGLEMTLTGGTFGFPEGAVLAMAGSDFGAELDGERIGLWASVEVQPGQVLRVGPTRGGARCYLCVEGGLSVPPFLGSTSTHLLSGLGGWHGRALRKGDVLPFGEGASGFRKRVLDSAARKQLMPRKTFRVTAGPQEDWFAESSRRVLTASNYRVAEDSNRIGIRLEGPRVEKQAEEEMITEGVSLGAIQIPPEGMPIVVFVEQQTTGGYPKIANVIAADLPGLGQLRPRDEIRFERVEMELAWSLHKEQEGLLASPELIRE